MEQTKLFDLIGIGIGPFNLGLAALTQPLECRTIFFDKASEFNWHPGLMLDDATLQVPFMADLVTMADPTSPYSFLNYLKQTGRIYRFYIRESFFMFRREYNQYCRWVLAKLDNCRFGHEIISLSETDGLYTVTVQSAFGVQEYYTRNLVLGTGTQPHLPECIAKNKTDNVIHTSAYLPNKNRIVEQSVVTIVGSGQSAAEIVNDLLPYTRQGLHLNWVTRSGRFFPLENHTRFTLEMTSPEYVDYFHALPFQKRDSLLKQQNVLYKGVNYDLLNTIFDTLYAYDVADGKVNVSMIGNSELLSAEPASQDLFILEFEQKEQKASFSVQTNFLIMATGYSYQEPSFLSGIEHLIARLPDGRFDVNRNYCIAEKGTSLYIQNGELHTHGLASPDLGMGAYRNARILNEIMGRQVYPVEEQIGFQVFDARFLNTLQMEPITVGS